MNERANKWMKPKYDVYDTHTHAHINSHWLRVYYFVFLAAGIIIIILLLIYLLVLYVGACYISTHSTTHTRFLSVALHRRISINASIQFKHFNLTDNTKFIVNTHTHTNKHVKKKKKNRSAWYHFTIHCNCFSLLHVYYY